MKSIIIGIGEVGEGLYEILTKQYVVNTLDRHSFSSFSSSSSWSTEYDFMHICFRYSEEFVEQVKKYQEEFKPQFTIVHSTVPVGTCRQLGAVHSPVVGQHPFMAEGIRTFPKMLGGEQASEVADYFRRAGLKVVLFDKSETTEAAKLFLTEYYRECINFAKRVKNYAENFDLSFSEIYTIPNIIYNEGYKKLGYEEFIRPILQPIMVPTGGHCVEPNSKLIQQSEGSHCKSCGADLPCK